METNTAWVEGTIYARHVDEDGNVTFQEHRCWNTHEFIRNVALAAAKVGGKSAVSQVTKAEFLKWKAR